MYELKTKLSHANVKDFLDKIEDYQRKSDSLEILDIIQKITNEKPKMWGTSIVGFGKFDYKSKSGIESEWMRIGFSPRKQALTLYLSFDISQFDEILKKLGKHKIGKGCLYIKKLTDVDKNQLAILIETAFGNTIH